MTPTQLIKTQLANHDIDDVIEQIHHNLKIVKSPNSLVVLRSKSVFSKQDVQTYLYEALVDENLCTFIHTKHRFKEFLEYLFEALDLSQVDYEKNLEICEERHQRLTEMKQPYIFAYTHFKRHSEPVFVLAFLEGKRRIQLNKSLYLDSSERQIQYYVANVIKHHFIEKKGELSLWGKISAYIYYDTEGKRTLYNCLGEVIEDDDSIVESRATLGFK